MEMHERTIEEGIAFAEHDHVVLARNLDETLRPVVIEAREKPAVFRAVEGKLRCDRIFHWIFVHILRQYPIDDAPRLTRPAFLAEIGDMPRGTNFAVGPHTDQIGIAGPEPTTDDAPHDYSLRIASAFTAATVIADPPRRPSTVRAGAGGLAIKAALASAAPTKPTGQPMIAAGRGQDSSSSMFRSWNSAVGALPMATTAPSRCGRHSSNAAAERVVPIACASAATAGSLSVQITALAAGRRARVTPSETIRASHRMGAPSCNAARARGAMPGVKRTCCS